MVNKSDKIKYHKCSKLMDEGKYVEAVKIAVSITDASFRAGILIDGGFALSDSSKVRKGTKIYEELWLVNDSKNIIRKISMAYNAANGYNSLYSLKSRSGKEVIPTNDSDLRNAKRFYRLAINNLEDLNPSFAAQVLINYGNCLSQFGRFIETIQFYERAFKIDPTNGMAAGNLAIELEHASRIMGRYTHEYLALAHDYLKQSVSPNMHLHYGAFEAGRDFRARLTRLEQFINAHKKKNIASQTCQS